MGPMELGMLANLLVAFAATTLWATRPVPTAAQPLPTRSEFESPTR